MEETIGMVAWNRFAKLLQGPGRHWMCGDVAMHASDLEEWLRSGSRFSGHGFHKGEELGTDRIIGVVCPLLPTRAFSKFLPISRMIRRGGGDRTQSVGS